MPYEEDIVKQAAQKGVFEDKLDPNILTADEQERQKLAEEFQKTQQQMASKLSPQTSTQKPKKKEPIEEDVSLNIIEKIILFILSLFGYTNTEAFKRRKKLKMIIRELKKIKPPVYDPKTRTVTKFFAYKIHDLRINSSFVSELYSKTINNPEVWNNVNIEKPLVEYLFERLAGMEVKRELPELSSGDIQAIIDKNKEKRKIIAEVERRVSHYLASIDSTSAGKANLGYINLQSFNELFRFDFNSFFRKFQFNYDPKNPEPVFTDVKGDILLSYLKELESVIFLVDLSVDNLNLFTILQDYLFEYVERDKDETEKQKLRERLKENSILLFESIKEITMKQILTLLIRVIRNDPDYHPIVIRPEYNLYEEYAKTLNERMKKLVRDMLAERRDKIVKEKLKKIFGKEELDEIGIYNTRYSLYLKGLGLPQFLFTQAVATVSHFYKEKYQNALRNLVNMIIIDGVFPDKGFQKEFTDSFYKADTFKGRIATFEKSVSEETEEGKKLKKLITSYKGDKTSYKILERKISSINAGAFSLIKEAKDVFSKLDHYVKKVLDDASSSFQKYVRNIKGIAGLQNKVFLSALKKSHTETVDFLDILEAYIATEA